MLTVHNSWDTGLGNEGTNHISGSYKGAGSSIDNSFECVLSDNITGHRSTVNTDEPIVLGSKVVVSEVTGVVLIIDSSEDQDRSVSTWLVSEEEGE